MNPVIHWAAEEQQPILVLILVFLLSGKCRRPRSYDSFCSYTCLVLNGGKTVGREICIRPDKKVWLVVVQPFVLSGLHSANRNCQGPHISIEFIIYVISNKTFFNVFLLKHKKQGATKT